MTPDTEKSEWYLYLLNNDSYIDQEGIRRWGNGMVVSPDILQETGLQCTSAHINVFLAETYDYVGMIESQSLESAVREFGHNVHVFDTITGRTWTT